MTADNRNIPICIRASGRACLGSRLATACTTRHDPADARRSPPAGQVANAGQRWTFPYFHPRVTMSDTEFQGERSPSRRYVRPGQLVVNWQVTVHIRLIGAA